MVIRLDIEKKRDQTDLGYVDRISLELHSKGPNAKRQLAKAHCCLLPNEQTSLVLHRDLNK